MYDAKKARERWANLEDKYKPPVDEMADLYFDLREQYESERALWVDVIREFETLLQEKRAGD